MKKITCGWACSKCSAISLFSVYVDLLTEDGCHSEEDSRRWSLATYPIRMQRDAEIRSHREKCGKAVAVIGTHIA